MDDEQQLSRLLERAAAGPEFAPPPLSVFAERHKQKPARRRSTLAVIGAAYIAVVIAIPLIVVAIARSGTSPAVTATAPSGPTAAEIAGYTWSALPPAPIAGRASAASVWTGREMLVWGGRSADGKTSYNDGASYDPATRRWQTLPPSPLSPRSDPAYVWTGDSLFVWGGYSSSDGHRATDGAVYEPSTGRWTMVPSVPISSYQQIQAIWTGKGVVLLSSLGLSAGKPNSQVVSARSYDPAGGTWTTLPTLAPPADRPLQFFQAVSAGGSVYLWSDWAKTTTITPNEFSTESGVDGYTLELAARKWSPNSLAPSSRADSSPIWTGSQILLPESQGWRGGGSGPYTANLPTTVLDPNTGAQRQLVRSPLANERVNALWTGSALLAFNGQTVAALDLAANTWRSTVAAPLTGGELAVVWTGKALLSWGLMYAPSKTNNEKAPVYQTAGQQLSG